MGMKVLVRHKGSKDGSVVMAKGLVQGVVHRYMGGWIRTSSGDIWEVKPVDHSQYDYITVATVG